MALGRNGLIKRRTIWLFIIFALAYGSLAARLYIIQCRDAKRYEEWARIIRCRKLVLPAFRGRILDRTGRPLAFSIQTASIYANRNEAGSQLRDVSSRVALLLGRDEQSLLGKLGGTASIVWLCRHIDPRLCERVRTRRGDLPGVGITEDTKRVYPGGSTAAQVLGFANVDGMGVEGLEHTLNRYLQGRDGVCRGELDARRRVIPETRCVLREPENGKDVCLTLDMTIQHVAEVALGAMARQYHPSSACAVVMDARTGEILALANYPFCGPNTPKAVKDIAESPWRNRAVANLYEPGSTLKVVTVSAALNEGISPAEVVAHCAGSEKVANGRIRCSLHGAFKAGHGAVDMRRLVEQSCNIGAAHLARRMGAEKLYGYEKAFGLLDRPRAGFGCEAAYEGMPRPEDWRLMKLCNVGFGQGIAVTALQMAGVYQTIANDGVRVEPRIIREVRNPDGSVCRPFRIGETRRVVSTKAARTMTDLLVNCVINGTGKNAKIAGRSVAGKTGSAQIALPKGGYAEDAFVASFMGFVPARSPRLVIAVVVHKPQGCYFGATVAAPVFREIGEKALWYLRAPADEPTAPTQKEADHKRIV